MMNRTETHSRDFYKRVCYLWQGENQPLHIQKVQTKKAHNWPCTIRCHPKLENEWKKMNGWNMTRPAINLVTRKNIQHFLKQSCFPGNPVCSCALYKNKRNTLMSLMSIPLVILEIFLSFFLFKPALLFPRLLFFLFASVSNWFDICVWEPTVSFCSTIRLKIGKMSMDCFVFSYSRSSHWWHSHWWQSTYYVPAPSSKGNTP